MSTSKNQMDHRMIPKDEKVCYNCKSMAWMVGLGLGVQCTFQRPLKPIHSLRHTCENFSNKYEQKETKEV